MQLSQIRGIEIEEGIQCKTRDNMCKMLHVLKTHEQHSLASDFWFTIQLKQKKAIVVR